MTNEQAQVKEWMQKFGQETPEKPTIPDLATRRLRAKLELEETLEKIEALGLRLVLKDDWKIAGGWLHAFNIQDNPIKPPNLKEIADASEDQKVVIEGTLVACGLIQANDRKYCKDPEECTYADCPTAFCDKDNVLKADPLFNEVMRSNNSKLWTTEEIRKAGFIMAKEYDFQKGWNSEGTLFCEEVKRDLWLVKNKDGKVIKSPSYSPANLQPIIDEMSK